MRTAIIHDWLTGMRGGERVLEVLCELFPEATLFTLMHHEGAMSPAIERMRIVQSPLRRWPGAAKNFRLYLPLFPALVERFDLRGYDLVISSSHCVAKGVKPAAGALHVCYCHTPMRYVWDLYDDYVRGRGPLVRAYLGLFRGPLRRWDRRSSRRVDHFIANSRHVAERIARHYGREAAVIHAPVDTDFFTPGEGPSGDYYLVVSAMVPYKRVDLAVGAFSRGGRKLVVIGSGGEEKRIRARAGANVVFKGAVDDETLRSCYRGARALVFPGVEDFGITPLEAMACGAPVVALAKGGVLETVVEGVTGHFFHEQSEEALLAAVDNFERMFFTGGEIRKRALAFSKPVFIRNIRECLEARLRERGEAAR